MKNDDEIVLEWCVQEVQNKVKSSGLITENQIKSQARIVEGREKLIRCGRYALLFSCFVTVARAMRPTECRMRLLAATDVRATGGGGRRQEMDGWQDKHSREQDETRVDEKSSRVRTVAHIWGMAAFDRRPFCSVNLLVLHRPSQGILRVVTGAFGGVIEVPSTMRQVGTTCRRQHSSGSSVVAVLRRTCIV